MPNVGKFDRTMDEFNNRLESANNKIFQLTGKMTFEEAN
jgi:hypothetical protein